MPKGVFAVWHELCVGVILCYANLAHSARHASLGNIMSDSREHWCLCECGGTVGTAVHAVRGREGCA